jgi:UDP-N-acetylmuramoyl-tripeptide--D-alanyl-D-alanine ligase
VIPIDLAAVATAVGGRVDPAAAGPVVVRAVTTDTRVTAPAPALFVALRTDRADGHDHVPAAAASGAVAVMVAEGRATSSRPSPGAADLPRVVVAEPWDALGALAGHVRTVVSPLVVGITGSYGKTTTKDLAAAALRTERRTVASRASHNNELGVPLTLLALEPDTEVLVAEVGIRERGDLDAAARLVRPDVAVVTAVGPVHLETLGDLDGVAAEKGRLVAALRPGGTAVLNADDPRVAAMVRPDVTILTVSADGVAADLRAGDVQLDDDGRATAVVVTPWGTVRLAPPLPGRHHLTNALCALAVAGAAGVDIEAAAAAIATAPTSASRSAVHRAGGVTVVDDAYNASPPTVVAALATLARLPAQRRWAVLGTMAELGADAVAMHREVGAACASLQHLVAVGEGGAAIAEGARAAGLAAERITLVPDAAAALRVLRDGVRGGDAVLVKGSRVVGLDRTAAGLLAALGGEGAA